MESSKSNKLNEILRLTHEMFQIKDLDILLEETLHRVSNLVLADAGTIYMIEKNQLKFSYVLNKTIEKRLLPGKKTIYTTFTLPIDNKSIAGYVVNNATSVNLEDVYNIPSDRPYKFDKYFDEVSGYHTKSVLTIPIKTPRNKLLGVIQLINAQSSVGEIVNFAPEDELLVQYFADNVALVIERAQLIHNMIMRMVAMASLRDPKETASHVNRVAAFSAEIYETWARHHGIAEKEIVYNRDNLKIAALLHDVGKVAIPDAILKKPGALTEEERRIMQEHSWRGSNLFTGLSSELDEIANNIVLNHHERWDGTGYPGYVDVNNGKKLTGYQDGSGKKGNEIPFFAQIVAIADVYDALNSKRCYKEPFEEEKILEIVRSESGKHFNPELVDIFFECFDVLRAIAKRYPDTDSMET